MKKRIMCFGDSNTWGYIPGDGHRYPETVRWTGILQDMLGDGWCIIEEGLNGRTTVFDKPFDECLNGLSGLGYALKSQKPLDCVVFLLGTNDLVNQEPRVIGLGMEKLVRTVLCADSIYTVTQPVFNDGPRILLIAPVPFDESVDSRSSQICAASGKYKNSLLLKDIYEKIAAKYGIVFLDASQYAQASDIDGIHLPPQAHMALGRAVYEKLLTMEL